MLAFLLGTLFGAGLVLFVIFVLVVDPWGPKSPPPPFIDQYRPIEIPKELRDFLKTGDDGQGISRWESSHSLSLLLHMFFQEHKDTRQLRRWLYKRLQIELNDISTRSAAGRLIQEIRIRDLSLGTKFPRINAVRVENVEMSEDKNIFENITLLVDMDYTGGFETSIDVTTVFGKRANLSIKLTKLAGLVRLVLSRKPYNHWTMSFVSTPELATDISSQIQGHQLKRLIPLIKESIRRALQRKHVWPNYKIRYRPLFPNPFLQPSPPLSAFTHVKIEGGLEVTVLQGTRLRTSLVDKDPSFYVVYCTVTLDHRPFLQNLTDVAHSLSVMLTFSRHDMTTPIGIVFEKTAVNAQGIRPVKVAIVEEGSLADKAAFKPGDTLIAINNVPIRSERQVNRFLQQTLGDLLVLVDRNLDDIDDDVLKDSEVLVGPTNGHADDAFVCLGGISSARTDVSNRRSVSPSSADSKRRHSMSNAISDPSVRSMVNTNTESLTSSLASLDVNLDRPTVATVVRTESDRVPQVLISQPSTDLRRTRSESQLDAKLLDAISVSSSASAELEDEISVYTVSSLGSEMASAPVMPTVEGLDEQTELLTPSLPTSREKDATLTPGMTLADVVREATAAAASSETTSTLHPTANGTPGMESLSSVASSLSLKTEDEAEEDGSGLSRSRPASTRRQRLHATLQASKRKVLDLVQKRRAGTPSSCGDAAEMGADAGEMDGTSEAERMESPMPSTGKRSPVEVQVLDKKEKRKKSKNRSPNITSLQGQPPPSVQDSPTTSLGYARSRTTKTVHFRENVLWGQSLHFELDGASSASPSKSSCKYLNVTVHAKEVPSTPPIPTTETPPQTISTTPAPEPEPPKPILLGYTSLYIPQILDDCQLTLSNYHREVFQLKPPTDVQSINEPVTQEFSRHAGYDPRLLYGDVTLGFRYFPDGLPQGAGLALGEESEEEAKVEERPVDADAKTVEQPSASNTVQHDWKPWSTKSGSTVCAMCRGKIWLKSASCCQRCLVVCHHKCVERAATGIICAPHSISQGDTQFAELDVDSTTVGGDHAEECPSSVIPSTPQTTQPALARGDEVELTSRRTRLRNKVTEKFTSWRKGGKTSSKVDLDLATKRDSRCSESSAGATAENEEVLSPMASIQDCLADVLPTLDGSPFIRSLYFQPGNAYNEQTINHAKVLGKEIFANLKGEERKAKINEQIDRIQIAIRETKDGRLAALRKDGADKKTGSSFEGLDERLQALAVLMLHYCAALQDCESHGTESSSDDVPNDAEPSAEAASDGRSFARMVTKIRHKVSIQRASFRKQVTKGLHVFDFVNSSRTNKESVSDKPDDANVERDVPSAYEERKASSTQDELNNAFLVMSEGPDPRLD